jgi:hypothetical protein
MFHFIFLNEHVFGSKFCNCVLNACSQGKSIFYFILSCINISIKKQKIMNSLINVIGDKYRENMIFLTMVANIACNNARYGCNVTHIQCNNVWHGCNITHI